MNRFLIFTASLLAICSCSGKIQIRHTDNYKLVKVRAIKAGESAGTAVKTYVGTVKSSGIVTLKSQNPGTLSVLKAEEGRFVHKGDTLAVVDNQGILSAHTSAAAKLKQAEDGWSRLTQAQSGGGVTEIKAVEVATQLEEARASEKAAAEAVRKMNITAPFDGVVDKVYVKEGTEMGLSGEILTLVDVSGLEVHFPLPESEFADIEKGKKADVTVPAIGKTFSCRLTVKGVVASQTSHSYECVLVPMEKVPGLMPGMVCKVKMQTGAESAIVIPASAVMSDMNGRFVWTANAGFVGKSYVRVGGYSGNGVIITDGISEGTSIIVEGSRKVSVGMKVEVCQ